MSWEGEIERGIAAAVRKLSNQRWPDQKNRFWHLGVEFDRTELDRALSEIALEVVRGTSGASLPRVVVLLHLLRRELPGVRANRLWPDVATLVNSHGPGREIGTDVCAVYFRNRLRGVFPGRLARDTDAHKYVKLVMDEAGVGFDRARIIREFLEGLARTPVDATISDADQRAILHEQIARDARPDVAVLEPALLNAGLALFRIQRALITDVAPGEAQLWSWPEFNAFIRGVVGDEIAYLVPDAESVFRELLPIIGSRIPCQRAFELLTENGTVIAFPPSYSAKSIPRTLEDVAIGTIRITMGSRELTVTTFDEVGSGPEIVRNPPERWMSLAGGRQAAIWRDHPFHVDRTGLGSAVARLVCDPMGRILGYAWGGLTRPGDRLVSISHQKGHPSIAFERNSSARPVVKWRWREGGFEGRVLCVGYYDAPEHSALDVTLDGRVIGRVSDARLNGLIECETAAKFRWSLDATVALNLRSAGRILYDTELRLPQRPLAVIGSEVFRLDDLGSAENVPDPLDEILLFGDDDAPEPECDEGTIVRAPRSFPRPNGMCVYIWRGSTKSRIPAIRWGDVGWSQAQQCPSLTVLASREMLGVGFRIRTTGSVWPVSTTNSENVTFVLDGIAHGLECELEFRCGPIVARCKRVAPSQTTLAELLSSIPGWAMARISGLSTVTARVDGVSNTSSTAIYFVPVRIQHGPVRIGAAPTAHATDAIGHALELVPRDQPRLPGDEVSATLTFPGHDELEPGSGVTFSWIPDYFDIVLRDGDHKLTDERLGLSELEKLDIDLTGDSSEWGFGAGILQENRALPTVDAIRETIGGLGACLESAIGRGLANVDEVFLTAYYRSAAVARWTIDLSPVPIDLRVASSLAGEGIHVIARVEWLGQSMDSAEIRLRDGTSLLVSTTASPERSGRQPFSRFANAELSVPSAYCIGYPDGRSAIVEAFVGSKALTSAPCTLPAIPVSASDIPTVIRALLDRSANAAEASAACRQILVLYCDHVLHAKREFPWEPDRLARVIDRQLGMADCAGTTSVGIRVIGALQTSIQPPSLRLEPSEEPSPYGIAINEIVFRMLERQRTNGTLVPSARVNLQLALREQSLLTDQDSSLVDRIRSLTERCEGLTQ